MKPSVFSLLFWLSLWVFLPVDCLREDVSVGMKPTMVKRGQRKSLMANEYGEISAVDVKDGKRGSYHLEFMTLEPNSLFLPVLLHADMISYVDTGSGKLSWSDDGKEMKRMHIKRGDVYRLHEGSVFFLQSNLETERQKLRIYSIFSNTDEDNHVSSIGAYSSISDLVLGFERRLLQSAFQVTEDVIEEMKSAVRPLAIVHAVPDEKKSILGEIEASLLKFLIGNTGGPFYEINGKKTQKFDLLEADPDFENCNGRSVTLDRKALKSLRGSNIGVFMVNLTKGSMMGPHWNPVATEIAIVLQGEGMVRIVCASNVSETDCKSKKSKECKSKSFRVNEGDVFATPRYYPMAQMSFNNDSFVFMGFSTSARRNYPQFLVGKRSVFQTLDKDILALSFNVSNSTIDALFTPQKEAIILDCTSCAEEEETKMKREQQEEEAREREEERRREEEEAERERREREQKEAEERQEEERRRQEEQARREQEEARREAEERQRRQREKEAAAKREREREQEAEERQEEERRRREEEVRREQEEARREEEERQRRQREKEAAAREERERREREQEEERRREEEEEEVRREQEEERQRRQREAEAAAREERERREREQEEAEGRREEERRRQEEARKEREGGEEAASKGQTKELRREIERARSKRKEKKKEEKKREEGEEVERKRRKKGRKEAEKKQQEERRREEERARREQIEARRQAEER